MVCQPGFNVTFLISSYVLLGHYWVKDVFFLNFLDFDVETDIEAVRLINGAANSGRLELSYNGTWGTVCDNFWSQSNAKVSCRLAYFDIVTFLS